MFKRSHNRSSVFKHADHIADRSHAQSPMRPAFLCGTLCRFRAVDWEFRKVQLGKPQPGINRSDEPAEELAFGDDGLLVAQLRSRQPAKMECVFGQRLRCAGEKELPLHAKHRRQRIDEFISGLSHSRLDSLDELFRLADGVPYISKRKALSAADQSKIGRIEFNCHLPVSAWGWEMSSSVYVTCITRSFYTQS